MYRPARVLLGHAPPLAEEGMRIFVAGIRTDVRTPRASFGAILLPLIAFEKHENKPDV